MAMLRLTAQVTLDAAAGDGTPKRTVTGVAVPYGVAARVSDGTAVRFEPGALPVEGRAPKLYLYHDSTQPIGLVTERVDDPAIGMMFAARIAPTPLGDEALTLAQEGVLDSVSVGVTPTKWAYDDDGTMVITAADWQELSLVPVPAFAGATIDSVMASGSEIPATPAPVVDTDSAASETETPHMIDQNTPAVIEASTVAQALFAQPKSQFALPRPSEYIAAFVRGGHEFAQLNANIKAAAPNVISGDTPGILPEIITGSVYDSLNPVRPFVSAIGTRAMPQAGATFRRPKITTRPVVTQQAVGELNPLNQSTVVVSNNDVTKVPFGTYLTVSEQDLDWTDPASLDIILTQLSIAYGQATDNYAVDTMVAGVSQTETVTDLTSAADWVGAIYGAAYQISNGSNYLPTHYAVAPITWAKLAQVVDDSGRPLFPFVGAPGLAGTNALGVSSASSWNGNPLGLSLIVDKNMAGGVASGNLCGVVGHMAGPAAGFEFYEQQKGAISVEVPSVMGRTIAWRGYAACFMADATKFVKLLAA